MKNDNKHDMLKFLHTIVFRQVGGADPKLMSEYVVATSSAITVTVVIL